MRNVVGLVFAGLVCLSLAACGDDAQEGMPDGPSTSSDLAATSHDLAVPNMGNCTAAMFCAANCIGLPDCFSSCLDESSPDAKLKFSALLACAYNACIGTDGGMNSDGGAGSCFDNTDTSGACVTCVANMEEGPTCAAELSACLSI